MTDGVTARITLAAVQARSQPGQVEADLEHAAPLVEHAASQGARLVVLPELFSCGYLTNRAVWHAAEGRDGATARWLAATARRLGIYLGAGTAESDGTDFYNAFILVGPDGKIAGRAYKANAEANIFRRGRSAHLIGTPLGRIGIGICADNQFTNHFQLMREQRADLILTPHAWPTPVRAAGLVSEADVADQQRRITDLPVLYARSLGVPVVFVNQVGPLLPIGGIPGCLMDLRIWQLRGQSRIIDSDGTVLGELADGEGVLVAAAMLDPGRKHYDEQRRFGGWLQPGPWLGPEVIIPLDITTGRLSYATSRRRKQRARAVAARTAVPVARSHPPGLA